MTAPARPADPAPPGETTPARAFWQISPRTYRVVTLLALLAVCFIIVTGAGVRLTGSGLGCTDWPTCEQNQFVAALDRPHAMIEFVNRTITGLVSVAVIVAVLGSLARFPRRRDLTWWSLGLVAGIVGQIVLGGVVVLFDLWPPLVIGHFVLSVILVWNAVVLHHKAGQAPGRPAACVPPTIVGLGRLLGAAGAVVLLTGTLVTGSGPHGGDENAERLALPVTSVARVHSVSALVFLTLTVVTLALLYRGPASHAIRRRAGLLVAAIVAQGAIGYLQYFTGVPVALVALHVLGSVLVWVAVLSFHLGLFEVPVSGEAVAPAAAGRSRPQPAPVPSG